MSKNDKVGNEKIQLYTRARMPTIHCANLEDLKRSHLPLSIEYSNRELMTVTFYLGEEVIGGGVCYEMRS